MTLDPENGKVIHLPELPSLSRIMSVVMLMFGILAVGVLFYQLMIGFFVPLFLAALLAVMFRPAYQWLLLRCRGHRAVAAGATTALILFLVLLPVGLLVSVATTQFTILLSQLNMDSMTDALDGVRSRFSLSLPHAAQYRELDRIVDVLNVSNDSSGDDDFLVQSKQLDRAAAIILALQSDSENAEVSQPFADQAEQNLRRFAEYLRTRAEEFRGQADSTVSGSLMLVDASERFEREAAVSAASIRSWMDASLGGAPLSQLRLIANPGEGDVAALIRRARESLQPRFVRLTSATGSIVVQFLFGLTILIVSVYFFLIDGPVMIRTLMRLSPMDDAYEHRLLMEFDRTSRAVVLASVASAVAQGFLATIGFALCGFDQIVLLFLMTSLLALVPFLGAAAVWVPCALSLWLVDDRPIAAALLAIYGATIVSSIDNLIKIFVLQGHSQLHPLFALLSVIGGVSVFGPIGILVGPMVVVFLQTLLEILNHELQTDGDPGVKPGDPEPIPTRTTEQPPPESPPSELSASPVG